MPYTKIHWIKLEKRLLNDYRFYLMSDKSQLIYIKLLMLAAEMDNKVPKSCSILRHSFRTSLSEVEIQACLDEIMVNFPKFRLIKGFYRFSEWSKRHNYIAKKESLGNSQGTPIDCLDKIRIDKKRIDKIREEYTKIKGFSEKDLFPDDYARMARAIKQLIQKSSSDDEVVSAINWISIQGYEWTLETLIRKYPDFKKQERTPEEIEMEKEFEKARFDTSN